MDAPSDFMLVASLIVAVGFSLNFSLGAPRVWFSDPLGWVIFLYSLAVDALLFLIVYGIVFGQAVTEEVRFAISSLLFVALVGKNVIVVVERRAGRQAYDRPARSRSLTGKIPMNKEAIMTAQNVTTDAAGKPTAVPQPKVIAGAVTGVALVVVVGAIAAITPEHFEALGVWGGVIYGGVVALGSALASYIKRPSNVN